MKGTLFTQPEYRVGASFLTVDLPFENSLTNGIASDRPSVLRGTDPAAYARDALRESVPNISGPSRGVFDVSSVGRTIAGAAVGLLLLAFGVWVAVKQ